MTREERWLRFKYNSTDQHLFKATQVATLNKVTYSTVLFVKCDFTDLVKENGSTELHQPVRTGRQSAFSYQEQGFVNGGSLASFTRQLSSVHRSDVLNSTLLAQLAASKYYDRNKEID